LRVPAPLDADDIAARLDRIKRLTQELDAAQSNRLKFNELILRIRKEAE
jgi:hypothetical protein